jgi:hypothetical protein
MNDLMPSFIALCRMYTSYKKTILVFTHAMSRQQRLCEKFH